MEIVQIQFALSKALASELEAFEAEAEIETHREMFANMVALWRWAAKRSREGKAIVALDQRTNRYNELILPALDWLKCQGLSERELNAQQPPPSEPEVNELP